MMAPPPPDGPLWVTLLPGLVFGLGALLVLGGSGALSGLASRALSAWRARRGARLEAPAPRRSVRRRPRPVVVDEAPTPQPAPASPATPEALVAYEALRARLAAARAAREAAGVTAQDALQRQALADRRAVELLNDAFARHGGRKGERPTVVCASARPRRAAAPAGRPADPVLVTVLAPLGALLDDLVREGSPSAAWCARVEALRAAARAAEALCQRLADRAQDLAVGVGRAEWRADLERSALPTLPTPEEVPS